MGHFDPEKAVQESIIFVEGVLNIFTDASIDPLPKKYTWNGCSGAIGVSSDLSTNIDLAVLDLCTNNIAELTAIELGVEMAIREQHNYKRINLFSDSRISVLSLREWFFAWVNNAKAWHNDSPLYQLRTVGGSDVKNYSIITEIINKISYIDPNICRFNLYHCAGHRADRIDQVIKLFRKENHITLSFSDARLLAYYNDIVDNETRKVVKAYRTSPQNFTEIKRQVLPFSVIPLHIKQYQRIIGGRSFVK